MWISLESSLEVNDLGHACFQNEWAWGAFLTWIQDTIALLRCFELVFLHRKGFRGTQRWEPGCKPTIPPGLVDARYYVTTLNTASKLIHRTFEQNAIEPHTETTQLLQQLHTIWKLKTKQFAIHTPLTPIKQQLIYRTMPNRAGLPFARPLVNTNINLYCSGLASTITMIHQTLDLSLTNSLKQLLT